MFAMLDEKTGHKIEKHPIDSSLPTQICFVENLKTNSW
jgi:hypothetical protein